MPDSFCLRVVGPIMALMIGGWSGFGIATVAAFVGSVHDQPTWQLFESLILSQVPVQGGVEGTSGIAGHSVTGGGVFVALVPHQCEFTYARVRTP